MLATLGRRGSLVSGVLVEDSNKVLCERPDRDHRIVMVGIRIDGRVRGDDAQCVLHVESRTRAARLLHEDIRSATIAQFTKLGYHDDPWRHVAVPTVRASLFVWLDVVPAETNARLEVKPPPTRLADDDLHRCCQKLAVVARLIWHHVASQLSSLLVELVVLHVADHVFVPVVAHPLRPATLDDEPNRGEHAEDQCRAHTVVDEVGTGQVAREREQHEADEPDTTVRDGVEGIITETHFVTPCL